MNHFPTLPGWNLLARVAITQNSILFDFAFSQQSSDHWATSHCICRESGSLPGVPLSIPERSFNTIRGDSPFIRHLGHLQTLFPLLRSLELEETVCPSRAWYGSQAGFGM